MRDPVSMKLFTLAGTLLLAATPALAVDFTGHWVGPGQITQVDFAGRRTAPCSRVEIILEHLPAQLTIERYHAICQTMEPKWGPFDMEIRDGKIYEDGEETGTLEGDTLRTLSQDGSIQYAFNLRLKEVAPGEKPTLESYYGVRSGMGTIVIEANLK